LPVSKITDQQNTHGPRGSETECLPLGTFHLLCHTPLFFPELGLFHQRRWSCQSTPPCSQASRGEFIPRKAKHSPAC
jgi:hypothetical protein